MVKNDNIPQEWRLKDGEKWETVFRNKTHEGPTLSTGSKFCLKYWVKGVCYDDCKHKASHAELNEQDRETGDNYVKELRGGI